MASSVPPMPGTFLELLQQLHADQRKRGRSFKEPRAVRSNYRDPLDERKERNRKGLDYDDEIYGLEEHSVLIGVNGGRSAALTAEHGNSEW